VLKRLCARAFAILVASILRRIDDNWRLGLNFYAP
jgi:hypothetical protein